MKLACCYFSHFLIILFVTIYFKCLLCLNDACVQNLMEKFWYAPVILHYVPLSIDMRLNFVMYNVQWDDHLCHKKLPVFKWKLVAFYLTTSLLCTPILFEHVTFMWADQQIQPSYLSSFFFCNSKWNSSKVVALCLQSN